MEMTPTRRSLLRAAAVAPAAFALRAQENSSWEQRCKDYLAQGLSRPAGSGPGRGPGRPGGNLHNEEAKLFLGRPIDPQAFQSVFDFLATRGDTVDFSMVALMRVLYLYGNDPRIPASVKKQAEQSVLDFRSWLYPDDPPVRTVACFWTENHQALYSCIEYLAGQMFPDRIFTWTGKPGSWHMEHGRKNLLVWLGLRARYGYLEWLSANYYSEDLIALLNIVDLARDPALQKAARGVADLTLLDLALHNFDGGMRASSGRSYFQNLTDASTAGTGAVIDLLFGQGAPTHALSGDAISLATSKNYRVPEAIVAIARDRPAETLIHEKSGLSPEEVMALGFRPDDLKDIFTFWCIQGYTYPSVFMGVLQSARKWNIGWEGNRPGIYIHQWDDGYVESWETKEKEVQAANGNLSKISDKSATALFGPSIETYRTPDYQLSTAQDYRKGKPGFQQQIWLASLGGKASVWTCNPGADTEQGRPSYWIGNGHLPRAAQHKNLAIVLYRIPEAYPRGFSHVYFPASEFDETKEVGGWLIGRKGDGYLAIASRPGMSAGTRKEYAGVERVANARESAWLCRMGRKAVDGPFEKFVEKISKSTLEYSENRVNYREPAGLRATFGWEEDFVVDGKKIPLGYQRFDTPYVRTTRGEQVYRIRCAGKTHVVDLASLKVKPFREIT
jgi:hypothetical protein